MRACTARTSGGCAPCSAISRRPCGGACLVDGFRLGPTAPIHRAVVDGDTKSAAIAAASIVAKVTRDRLMRRLDALYPRYGFVSHVGYITPGHSAAVRRHGPSEQHRKSFQALATRLWAARRVRSGASRATSGCGATACSAERLGGRQRARPRRPPRPQARLLRGQGEAGDGYGDPLEMVDEEKVRRLRRAAEAWLAPHPECLQLDCRFEVAAVRRRRSSASLSDADAKRGRGRAPAATLCDAGGHYPRTGALVRTATARARRPQSHRRLEKPPADLTQLTPPERKQKLMSITSTRLATRPAPGSSSPASTALFVGIGASSAGRAGLILFAGIAVVFNLFMFW